MDTMISTTKRRECIRLREFKDFLGTAKVSKIVETNEITEPEDLKNDMKRISKDSYYVLLEERDAEVAHTLWTRMQAKRCPQEFQIKTFRAAIAYLQMEFARTIECEIKERPYYDLLQLKSFVLNHFNKLLLSLTDNATEDNLKNFADEGTICVNHSKCQCGILQAKATSAVAETKNKPRKMEDRHVCLERFSDIYEIPNNNYSFYGIFDGHCGTLSATYAASQLPQLLAKELQKAITESMDAGFYRQAFESAFLKTDELFTNKKITSGTTAVCALLTQQPKKRHLFIAWVGDSKALLVGSKANLQLVKSHEPNSLDEKKRIEKAGGSVIYAQGHWRVNGILNIARSIGDYNVEPVIAEPDFVDIELTAAHDFLVLGSDGLFDYVSETTICAIIYTALLNTTQLLEDIPKLLIKAAKEGNSQDNITAMIILLKRREDIVKFK